ncbi:MAG TPA: ATP-binding protein [Chthoniobacterales bacterium]|nr:ATP-binding protein [Chthoniobacterales bacterium]
MKPGIRAEDWSAANQGALMAEVAALSRLLRGEPNEPKTTSPDAAPLALDALCTMFRLSSFEGQVLLLCAALELDGGFAAQCAAAPGSGGNPWPSFGLALALFPEAHWDALGNRAPLRHWRLIETIGNGPLVASRLQIDERILFFLTGVPQLDERLVSLIEPLRESGEISPTQAPLLAQLSGAWQAAFEGKRPFPALQLCGADLSAKRALAAALTNDLTIQLFRLPVAALPVNLLELENLHRLWEREAILENAALLLECDRSEEADSAREHAIGRWIQLTHTPLLISSREPRRDLERAIFTIEVPKPTRAEQRRAWEEAMTEKSLNGQLDRVVAQFDFSTAAIRTTATGLLGEEAKTQLWDACRLQARPRLQDLSQRITSHVTWADIVLPAPQLNILQTIAQHLRQRTRVYDDWGFAEQSNRGLGLSALFTGPSGTGKTLAAEILANELQLDLFRIDLSAVVSKYIGETEKNLRRVFDAAEEGGAVLLFDEADALFGKRSEVKDSHDRYANVEISYLLQRMEAYRGLAILTTNMKEALDPAFLRRLRFIVQFPFPDQAQRAEIWRRIFPAKTPTDSLDINRLSRLSISGGNIRSIALNAAFAAADADEPVRMPHLLDAVRLEYEKLEKPLTETELGGWR